MNKQLLMKVGPAAGLVISLLTSGVAGYRIFAAPVAHAEDVPSLPTPSEGPVAEGPEDVQTVYDDVYVTPTPKPTTTPTTANSSPSTVVSGVVQPRSVPTTVSPQRTGSSDDRFEDEEEDHVEFGKKEDHESPEETHIPEPSETPEPTETPEH